jgi:hypothetical protein
MSRRVRIAALCSYSAALGLVAATVPAPANAGSARCAHAERAYAGLISKQRGNGVAAIISPVSRPRVAQGNVWAWVGVGGRGMGAGGTDAWLQIGINAQRGAGNSIYAETWTPGRGQTYVELGKIPTGGRVRVAVTELAGRPGWWRAWLSGKPATRPVHLRGSHGRWQPMAVTESWNEGAPVCNSFRYRFQDVRVATGPAWTKLDDAYTLADHGYLISERTPGGFVAASHA